MDVDKKNAIDGIIESYRIAIDAALLGQVVHSALGSHITVRLDSSGKVITWRVLDEHEMVQGLLTNEVILHYESQS